MPISELARGYERLEALKGRRRGGGVRRQHGFKLGLGTGEFGGSPSQHGLAQDGGGGLTQRTGLDILRKTRDPPVRKIEIDGHGRSAEG